MLACSAAADDGVLYLRTSTISLPLAGGTFGTQVLARETPTTGNERTTPTAVIAPGGVASLGEFVSLPSQGVVQVNPSPATAVLYLQGASAASTMKAGRFGPPPSTRVPPRRMRRRPTLVAALWQQAEVFM
jgi:hypothetical protein